MTEQQYRRRSKGPSIFNLDEPLDSSMEDERERERKDFYMKQLIHSNAPIEKDLVRGVAIGAFNFAEYEEQERTSHYVHSEGFFGHSKDEESNSIRIRRWSIGK